MKNGYIYLLAVICLIYMSCKKSTYLDAVPSNSLVIPQSLSDYQALLDNDQYMNGNSKAGGLIPAFEEAGTDDYYVQPSSIASLPLSYVNLYSWNDNIWSQYWLDWADGYRCAFYSNSVLDGLSNLTISSQQQNIYNNIKGSALFYRAHIFYHLAQVFAPPYNQSTANNDWGIPLTLTSNINQVINRSSVQQTYEKIIDDLKSSLPLLPITPLYKTRPSKTAAYGLLAKVYLSMRDYPNALSYSDSCLQLQNNLLDYNALNATSSLPFARFNNEVIFQGILILTSPVANSGARVDSSLYSTYTANDLRKVLFFQNVSGSTSHTFKGSYDGSSYLFGGISTNEMYLIHAECNARAGNIIQGMTDLNSLLIKRWRTSTFVPYVATNTPDALSQVLTERRKELVFRGTRWTDLRRLNIENSNISLTRVVNGLTHTLPPTSLHYTYLIPPDVIGFNPTMPQNQR